MSRIEEALTKAARQQAQLQPASGYAPETPMPQHILVDPDKYTNDKLVVIKSPESVEAEEFRKLKEALLNFIHVRGSFDNVFLITSPNQGEGKSLVAVNLAITLAQEYDHTVLLMDADLRKPTCHRYLELSPEIGLTECLQDGKDIGQALIKTGIGKLMLLPAGKALRNPLELFTSQAMNRLIQELKNRYRNRIILIDTPPVLMFAETRTLANLVDNALLVVREGTTSLDDVNETLSYLSNKVVGLVYNATHSTGKSQHYYYYYAQQEQ
jgi:exopolysaccharide/PEP-CTERM locus tyrosine autokinase